MIKHSLDKQGKKIQTKKHKTDLFHSNTIGEIVQNVQN